MVGCRVKKFCIAFAGAAQHPPTRVIHIAKDTRGIMTEFRDTRGDTTQMRDKGWEGWADGAVNRCKDGTRLGDSI